MPRKEQQTVRLWDCLKLRRRQEYMFLQLQFNLGLEVLVKAFRQERIKKGIQVGMSELF